MADLADHDDETRVLLVERPTSFEPDTAYRARRAGPGVVTDLAPTLAAPPRLTTGTPGVVAAG